MALASIWAPKTPPKRHPKGGTNPNLRFIDFAAVYYTLAIFRGAENDNVWLFFLNPCLGWLWELILVILAHFWGPFWKPFWLHFRYHFCIDFCTPQKHQKKRVILCSVLSQQCTLTPLLGLLPPS